MDSLCGEPVCLWLPGAYKKPGTSTYVQGVEAEADYHGEIPEGFDVISLPAAEYLARTVTVSDCIGAPPCYKF